MSEPRSVRFDDDELQLLTRYYAAFPGEVDERIDA
jgi:hypothetical protein